MTRKELIAQGDGTSDKEEQTYREAARLTEAPPSAELAEIVGRARQMAREN